MTVSVAGYRIVCFFIVCSFVSQVTTARAQCNPTCAPAKWWVGSGTTFYFDNNVMPEWRVAFNQAATEWNNAHAGYGRSDMYLNRVESEDGLKIVMQEPPSCSTCPAEYDRDQSVIYLNPYVGTWQNPNHRLTLALHEFGHQMGFDDVYGCNWGSVMGQALDSPYWLTDSDYCGMNTYYDPFCEAAGGEDYYNHCTPLVLSFRGLPHLSAPEVPFDIAANGDLPLCGWLNRASDGLLVLDRDGDGRITSGRELFGNATPLSAGIDGPSAWSGFSALEFFDRPENGGNGNRLIDSGDTVFSKLRIWFDKNRDGVTQSGELVKLAQLGILHIRLDGWKLDHIDTHGNKLWFVTTFEFRRGSAIATGTIVDVIFKVR